MALVYQTDTQEKISTICNNIESLLLEKNIRYGDSAISPMHVFSKQDADVSICTRLDDKLSRIANNTQLNKNDVYDTIGYLVLLCIANGWDGFQECD